MQCPACRTSTKLAVLETRQSPDGPIRRRRRCEACGLAFSTHEQIASETLMVRKANRTEEPFNRTKLRRGIVKAAVRPYHRDRLNGLVDEIFQEALVEYSDTGVIESSHLAEIVMAHLREFDPVQHVRFALTQIGRLDRELPNTGWVGIDEFRRWLVDSYPELEHYRPSPRLFEVVKRSGDGRREPFDRKKLERSIGLASKGRLASSDAVHTLAREGARAVESELMTQSIVTSGQIGSEVIRWLRRHDTIAAIRFASTAKQFSSVFDFESEALGLRSR